MQLFITKQIGKKKHTFVVEGENLFELQMEAQKLSFYDVYKCGKCESENLYLHAYITKEKKFKYIKIACNDCKASLTFGQKKDSPNTFYLRKEDGKLDWQKFEEQEIKKDNPKPEDKTEDNIGGEDLPF